MCIRDSINIKDTSVLNVIGVTELYYFAGIIKRQSFETFQTYLVVLSLIHILLDHGRIAAAGEAAAVFAPETLNTVYRIQSATSMR